MLNEFSKMKLSDLRLDPVKAIGHEWMLITSGNDQKCNTMTASWGGTGYLWNKPVAFVFVRPQRFTYGFMEENALFTCSFFDKKYHKAMQYCGANSGREVDKFKATGLTPLRTSEGAYTLEEAQMFLVCRKMYFQDIHKEGFLDAAMLKHYPENDFHRMYIGEIISAYERINYKSIL
jgi:flavin reductase (DIM6/NTAB) family NADH-FMN oxidoreductase RutF